MAVAVAIALALAVTAVALPSAARPVLHERVVVPELRCQDGLCRRDGAAPGELPEAVVAGDALVPAPPLRPPGTDDGPVYRPTPEAMAYAPGGAPQPGQDLPPLRRLRAGPDRDTGPEPPGGHPYHEVFNPAVFPFKRMTVLDAVAEDETLRLRDPALVPVAVPVGPPRRVPGRDAFYGTLVVDLQGEQPVPLPTPAAGVRLLSYEASPLAALRFFRDGAENLYVSGEGSGRHRLVFLVDAEQRYFAGPLLAPGQPRPRIGDVPAAMRPALPARVLRRARLVLRHIGLPERVRPEDDYLQVLERLVTYFRDFQVGELGSKRGSTYLDLAVEQRGVCRHRSYAFVITAMGAGMPARYVENELHVYAEVWVPERGGGYWRRVHLGGAPLEEVVMDAEDKVAYEEKGGDPFPQPPAFTSGAPKRVSGGPRRGEGAPSGSPSASASGSASASTSTSTATSALTATRQGPGTEVVADEEIVPAKVSIGVAAGGEKGNAVYRGATIRVQGKVQARGEGRWEVQILLDTPEGGLPLASTIAGPDGSYQAEVEIPREAPLGDHRLLARVRKGQ